MHPREGRTLGGLTSSWASVLLVERSRTHELLPEHNDRLNLMLETAEHDNYGKA